LKRRIFLIACCLALGAAAALGLSITASSSQEPQEPQPPQRDRETGERQGIPAFRSPHGKMVIANRASGTITVIDVASDHVIGTYALPAGAKTPEPMYVVYSRDRVFVGDRANNRVAVFNPRTFTVETTVPAGAVGEILAFFFPRDADVLRADAEGGETSRLYDGTHWRFDVEAGLATGRAMAPRFIKRAKSDGAHPAR